MPGTEVVRKQTVLGGAAGIALLAFALIWRFYPAAETKPPAQEPAPVAAGPALTIKPPLAPVAGTVSAPEPEPEPEPAPPAVPPSKEIALLLKRAGEAVAKDHLLEPKEDNALELYRQVLMID